MIIELKFSDAEVVEALETIEQHHAGGRVGMLLQKLGEQLEKAGGPGGAYRKPGIIVADGDGDDDDDDFDWVNDAKNTVALAQLDTTATMAAEAKLTRDLARRNDLLTAQLHGVRGQVALQEENERLKLELAAVGPPEMEQEIAMYKKKLTTAEQAVEVVTKQRNALSTALTSERIDRQRLEDRSRPELDPCGVVPILQPPVPYSSPPLALIEAEASIEKSRNVARLTGRLDEFDAALKRRGLNPEAGDSEGSDG